ncbi:MAG TPA: carboxypeptidase-like regulatory domain-containing protein [Blastocatellia bacterium]|nr:carboxypeptidase-like regulatory domain-containing protein [Blastocatellia bacterium]
MRFGKRALYCTYVIVVISLIGCKDGNKNSQPASGSTSSPSTTAPSSTSAPPGEVEKAKPAPGTGNVQGKVLYNGQPVENIEVKLCEKFNQYFGGCEGKSYTTRTDKNGEYLIANVEPKTYEGLLARVFNTDSFIFAAEGFGISSAKYEVAADKTLFVRPTNLFKSDLKTLNPKAGSKVSVQNLELKWEPYPDAAYYKFSLYADDVNVTSPYVNERVDGTSFAIDKPMQKGTYRWKLEAYNSADIKLAENSDEIKFTITDGGGS